MRKMKAIFIVMVNHETQVLLFETQTFDILYKFSYEKVQLSERKYWQYVNFKSAETP